MAPQTPAIDDGDLDGLLEQLDEADRALRALYRQLADDPGLAPALDADVLDLRARRQDLAQRVGLALLARSRAEPGLTTARAPTVDNAASRPPVEPAQVRPAELEPEPGASCDPLPESSPPASAPVSSEQLAQWTDAVRASGLGSAPGRDAAPIAWPLVLDQLMQALGPPRPLDTTLDVIDELEALDAIGTPEAQERWTLLPRTAGQAWLSLLVARTRALKELPSTTFEGSRERVRQIIGRYPPWAKQHTPGHVNGLQTRHAPSHGSWTRDASAWWTTLQKLLDEQTILRPAAAPTRRKSLSDGDVGRHEDAPESGTAPPWPLQPLVRGRTAALFGGDPREPNRARLERDLELASLEWTPIDGPRKVSAAAERIRKGSYSLVLVLAPFVAHQEAGPLVEAAKDAGVAWALVDGYGLTAIRLGLERFLGGADFGRVDVPERVH